MMLQVLTYVVMVVAWAVFVISSIWIWRKAAGLGGPARTFLLIALATFYVLAYMGTSYWLGLRLRFGAVPPFVAFLVLFIITIRAVMTSTQAPK